MSDNRKPIPIILPKIDRSNPDELRMYARLCARRKYWANPEIARLRRRKWLEANRQKSREISRRAKAKRAGKVHALYQENKQKAFALFGGKCQNCGYADIRALQIDHKDRYAVGQGPRGGGNLYLAIVNGKVPLVWFQLLCANCHRIKTVENKEFGTGRKRISDAA